MQQKIQKRIEIFANQIRSRQRENKLEPVRTAQLIKEMSETITDICQQIKGQMKQEVYRQVMEAVRKDRQEDDKRRGQGVG